MSTWDDKPNDYEHALQIVGQLRDLAASLMALLDQMPVKHPQQGWQRNELRRQFDAAIGHQQRVEPSK